MAYGDTFKQFLVDNNIGRVIDVTNDLGYIFLSSIEVNELIRQQYAKNAERGGIVIGDFHTNGGVHMLKPHKDGFIYSGEMEGYEFLFSPQATTKHINIIKFINSSISHDVNETPKPFHIPFHVRKIDLRQLKFHIIILSNDDHYIINRTATKKYLGTLSKLNGDGIIERIKRLL